MLCTGIMTRLCARTKWRSKLKPSESSWWIQNISMKESSEDICYDKELVKLDCPGCEQVLYSKGTFNMVKTEERIKGSFGFWFSSGAALLNL